MAYVPDYVRPIGPKSVLSVPVTPTGNNQNHRRAASFVITPKSAPATGIRVERSSSSAHSPDEGTPSGRRTSINAALPPARFVKSPQERICSRLSIKERLRSLESEGGVTLEVRHTSQRPKRRSLSHGIARSRLSNSDKDRQSEDTSSISSISSVRTIGDPSEKWSDSSFLPMPKPDIISSNQPKSHDTSGNITPEKKLNEVASNSSADQVELLKESFERLALALEKADAEEQKNRKASEQIDELGKKENSPAEKTTPLDYNISNENSSPKVKTYICERDKSESVEHNSTKYCNKDNDYVVEEEIVPACIPVVPKLTVRKSSYEAASGSSTEVEEPIENIKNNSVVDSRVKANASNSKNKPKPANGSVFKPIWRTPSVKQQTKPPKVVSRSEGQLDDRDVDAEEVKQSASFNSDKTKEKVTVTSEAPSNSDRKQNLNVSNTETDKSEEKKGSESFKETTTNDGSSLNTITTQSSSNTTTTVELRSPRHEHSAQGLRRSGARDKRNARVFIVPSSSDSDMDNANQQSRMERDFAKLGFPRVADLHPKSPANNSVDYGNNNNYSPKAQETPTKQVTPGKFVPDVLKSSPKTPKLEERRGSLDRSIDIYPELSSTSRSQRKDLKPHDGELKKDSQKSPNRRRRSTRSGRSGSSRSKSTDSRKTSKDVHRHRSNSMCDPKRMRSGQEAVANAVIYGTGAAIPYIDDVSSPTEELSVEIGNAKNASDLDNNRGSIHRSNSADVLSTLTVETSPTKLRRVRASSVDRSASKTFNRRSYQIATMNLEDPTRLQNIGKLNFLLNADGSRNTTGDPSLGDLPATKSGPLHFKVATIDKGKRTSSQKSWKLVWATLKNQQLCLSKDYSKAKSHQDTLLERQQSLQEEIQSLNVQSSLVGIAYNYLKRRNVFRLTTFNGSEYLFQAENRNEMLSWITAIQKQSCAWENGAEGINEELILRKTNQIDPGPKSDKRNARKRSPKPSHKNNLQVKDVDGSRRFKWRGSVNKIVKKFGTGQPFVLNGTFGVHLEDCPPSPVNEFVPFIVELCCRMVEDRGLEFTGIYRVPGNNAALLALQDDLNNHGVESINAEDERLRDLNVVSSLLKSFFRKLPEPLFTNELYHDFIQGNRQPTPEKRLNSLRKLVHMLPGPHYETLKFLISHLRLVADHCEFNKMEVRNLAIVFGPTLVRNTAADNTATMVTDMSDQCRIIESIIEHSEWFFSENGDEAPDLSTASVPIEKEHEAVPNIEFLLDNVGRKPGDAGASDSAKSKGSDDSENSFSRDLMEMIFGKKWKHGAQPQPATEEDDGGFGEFRSKKRDETPPRRQEQLSANINILTDPTKITTQTVPGTSAPNSEMPNVSERLMNFYQEYLERLSQTTIGQTLPAFSSADSSPRTTPRHSTVFTAPLVFPPQGGNRSRLSSDSQDPRHNIAASYEILPNSYPPQASPETLRSVSVPYYRHPPNPYQHTQSAFQSAHSQYCNANSLPQNPEPNSYDKANTPLRDVTFSPPYGTVVQDLPKPKPRKPSAADSIPYADDTTTGEYPQIEPHVVAREVPVDVAMDENEPPLSPNERLVGELPKVVVSTSSTGHKTVTVSRKHSNSSLGGGISSTGYKVKGHSKKASITSFDSLASQPQQKRRKSPLKENFSTTQAPTTATSERLFSRYDPKRRGIRFAGNENDSTANTSNKKNQLSATERLFNGQQQQQQLRRKPSTRENRKQKVVRRHTLSGIQDLQEHSPTLRFKSNLQRAAAGQNLSLHDLTSTSGSAQPSAMERLNPQGANSGLTLSNWIVQERLRNKTSVQQNNLVSGNPNKQRKNISKSAQVLSYV